MLKPEFVRRTMEAAERLVDATASPGPALLFGSILNEGGQNYNVMILADGGRVLGADAEAGAAQLRHVRRKARVRLGPAAGADRASRA